MKLMNLIFVFTILLIVICSGHKNGNKSNNAVIGNKGRQHVKKGQVLSQSRADKGVLLTLEPGKNRKDYFNGKRNPLSKEARIKTRSAIKNTEETPASNERRRHKDRQQDILEPMNSKKNKCPHKCVTSKCLKVDAPVCSGVITKDSCGCCPICKLQVANETSRVTTTTTTSPENPNGNACSKLVCPEFTECILNIQGIPVCRCPNMYACQSAAKDRICSVENRTYKNRCFLKIDECARKQKIEVAYLGDCKEKTDLDILNQVDVKEPEERLPKKLDIESQKSTKNKKKRTSRKIEGKKKQKSKKYEEDTLYLLQLENDGTIVNKKQVKNRQRKRI